MTTLCDSAFQTHLSRIADTSEKLRSIHISFAFYRGIWACRLGPYLSVVNPLWNSSRFHSLPGFVSQTALDFSKFISMMCQPLSTPSRFLPTFMCDPSRARDLYHDSEMWNSFLANCCIEYAMMRDDSFARSAHRTVDSDFRPLLILLYAGCSAALTCSKPLLSITLRMQDRAMLNW